MPRASTILALAVLLAIPAFARAEETSAYWIFLKDKGAYTDHSLQQALSAAQSTFAPAAIARRENRGTSPATLSLTDLPVNPAYTSAITSAGVSLRTQSSWLNAVSINATPAQLAALSALPFVDHVQPVATFAAPQALPVTPAPAASAALPPSLDPPPGFYGFAGAQLNQIKIPQVHALGYTGAGITIGVLDTGFVRTNDAFNFAGHPIQVLAEHDFINNTNDTSSTVNGQHNHGTYILGAIGAYKPNTLVGGAYNAQFILAKTEVVPTETQIEEDYWVAGLQYLEQNGADLVTSSLGYVDWYSQAQLNGNTAVTTIAANIASANGLVIVNAAGNQGHDLDPATGHLLAPADAMLVISVGAADLSGAVAGFSSDGHNSLGYLKPELLACGVSTWTVDPNSDANYVAVSGTSLATPLVASAVALIMEAHPDWSVADIRTALINTASFANSPDPLGIAGYGVIDVYAAINYPIPEPASLSLLLVGVPFLLARRTKRK